MDRDDGWWFGEGARQAAMGPAWIVGLSLVSVGGLAHDVGVGLWIAGLSTLIVWAGPGQLIYFASIASGAAPIAILAATTLAGVRFVPMVVSLLPRVRGERTGAAAQILASHFIAVTVWVEMMRRAPEAPRERRMAFFFGFSTGCIVIATALTMVGFELSRLLPPALAAALLFVSPIYFTCALMRGAREGMDWIALGLGLALAPVMNRWIGGGLDLLVTGLVGGALAYGWRVGARMRSAA